MELKRIGFRNVISDFGKDINRYNISVAVVAVIFVISTVPIYYSAAAAAGLGTDFILPWITALFLINGLFGVIVSAYYRLPTVMANSIPGALLFAAVIPSVGLAPTLGATLIAGIISLLVGLSGAMGKIMRFTPMPIVSGMIVGVLLSFGLDMIAPMENAMLPTLLMIISYILFSKFFPKFPPVLGSFIVGIIYLAVIGIDFTTIEFSVKYPEFVFPEFTLAAFLAYGLPLAIILIGMDTPTGVGMLKSAGYKNVPTNGITKINGIGTMVSSFFCLHSTCIAAPMVAMSASPESGKKHERWVTAVLIGLMFVLISPFIGAFITLIEVIPSFLTAVLAGLALIKVLISIFGSAFSSGQHQFGTIFAFLIAASDIVILGVGSSFWALVFGIFVSLLLDTKDFKFKQSEHDQQKEAM